MLTRGGAPAGQSGLVKAEWVTIDGRVGSLSNPQKTSSRSGSSRG